MPKIYSDDLCEIIKSMLAQEPETRPSVARLLRHSFIKKQIALFLEGTKNRQRKRSKGKATQESSKVTDSKSEISLKSDSGYSGMDSRETPDLLTAALPQRKRPGDEDLVKPEVHREEQKKNHCEEWVEVSGRGNAPGPMHDAREVVERKYSVEKIHAQSEIYCGDVPKSRRKKKDGRENSETNDRQQSRSRPLPPKPPNQAARAESNSNTDVKIPRERRRFKVAKPMDDKRSVVQIQRNSKNRVESGELKPTVSSGNPTSARERRRQRERESMAGRESAPPSSVQILSPSADRLPVGPQITSEGQEDSARSRDSSLNEDTTDGPPRRITPSQKKEKSNSGPDDDVVEENSSGVSDADENSLEEAMLKSGHKARRKESTDVNSLISALDTTLKLSEQRQSPDLDLEPEEERTDEPGDISVSSGRLRDRIDFLRRDCIQGLGEADFLKACDIIDSQSEENVEHALVKLIGRVKFEKYGGKIWQLKFCETFKRN